MLMLDYNMKRLEQLTFRFDKILFFPYILDNGFLKCELSLGNMKNKKIFIILSDLYNSEYNQLFVLKLSQKDTEDLIQLYYTYEFADNFLMVTDDDSFVASIFNFVETGILTYEEAWQALLS